VEKELGGRGGGGGAAPGGRGGPRAVEMQHPRDCAGEMRLQNAASAADSAGVATVAAAAAFCRLRWSSYSSRRLQTPLESV
jgi:hypothetical protein